MPCSADVHFLQMRGDPYGCYWPTVAPFCVGLHSFISAWHIVMSLSPCPALTVHVPSAGVHVCLIYWVQSQCCIICVLRKDINPSSQCGKWLFFSSYRLNVHCLRNDTSSRYFWAKAELYNFPISSECLSVERRNYMALNGFLNSDITS